jgi:hypothetical protein
MATISNMPTINPVSGIFLAVIAAACALTFLILILPSNLFLALSNYLQIFAALAGAVILLYFRHRAEQPEVFLFAGAGFGLWGLANIAWYITTFLGFRSQVFPSAIDIGLVLGLILLAYAFWIGRPQTKPSPVTIIAILFISIGVPAIMILTTGAGLSAALATFVYFATCGFLIAGSLKMTNGIRLFLISGAVFLGLSHMLYPLREIYLVTNPVFSIIGTIICIGFALVLLGLLPLCGQRSNA